MGEEVIVQIETTVENITGETETPQNSLNLSQLRREVLEVIDELEESYEEGYEFFGFGEESPETAENNEIMKRIKEVVIECKEGNVQIPKIKDVQWKKVKVEIDKVNNALQTIKTSDLTEDNYLAQAA